jgi:hypothetical protein
LGTSGPGFAKAMAGKQVAGKPLVVVRKYRGYPLAAMPPRQQVVWDTREQVRPTRI